MKQRWKPTQKLPIDNIFNLKLLLLLNQEVCRVYNIIFVFYISLHLCIISGLLYEYGKELPFTPPAWKHQTNMIKNEATVKKKSRTLPILKITINNNTCASPRCFPKYSRRTYCNCQIHMLWSCGHGITTKIRRISSIHAALLMRKMDN